MTTFVDAGSDLDMLSQTENEDTDTGEVSTVSDTSITPSSATDSSLEMKREKLSPTTKQSRPILSVNISADLTDVTDLEENLSSIEDNAQSSKVPHSGKYSNTETGIPTMFTMDNWYNQKCFENYWNHYNQVMSWCGKHFQVYNNLASKTSRAHCVPSQAFDNHYKSSHGTVDTGSYPYTAQTIYHPYVNSPCNKNKSPVSGRKKSGSRRKAKHRKIKSESCSEETITETETESSEVIEMEVTQDMIDFYAKTMEHRIKRDKEKKAEELEASTQPEHVNVEDIKITDTRTPTVEAPKERPGARRTAEMKLLYGKGAAMIHGMETALQMTFDRNLDVRQPKTWPNMPLRVVFG